jgi:hypothetical protein
MTQTLGGSLYLLQPSTVSTCKGQVSVQRWPGRAPYAFPPLWGNCSAQHPLTLSSEDMQVVWPFFPPHR